MIYITYEDLCRDIRQNLTKIPRDVCGVIGVPRSGMLPATIIAEYLNVPMYDLHSFKHIGHGGRPLHRTSGYKFLVVDDTCFNGYSTKETKQLLLNRRRDGADFVFLVTPEPELTDWEKFISGCLQKHGLLDCGGADRIAKECSSELLELARKELEPEVLERLDAAYKNQDEVVYRKGKRDGKAEALKDLPRWRRCGKDTLRNYGEEHFEYRGGVCYLVMKGREILLSDLEKLPGFNE